MRLVKCCKKNVKITLLLAVNLTFVAAKAEDDGHKIVRPKQVDPSVVVITAQNQALSGIQTSVLIQEDHHAEFEALGKVVNIQPLLVLKERYLTVKAELNGARALSKQAGQSYKRQQALYKHGVAAKRSMQEHEAQGLANQALVETAKAKLMAIANETRLNWGSTLAEWALADSEAKLIAIISGQQQLVQVTLPVTKYLAENVTTIAIEPAGVRSKARPASLISISTLTDSTLQGTSYFFSSKADGLTIGMKVSAWIPEPESQQSGVIVPESALVWYMDQVYVYVKIDKNSFNRRLIKNFSATADGYFVPNGLSGGDEIVTTGGQLLLSEQFRQQIPDED